MSCISDISLRWHCHRFLAFRRLISHSDRFSLRWTICFVGKGELFSHKRYYLPSVATQLVSSTRGHICCGSPGLETLSSRSDRRGSRPMAFPGGKMQRSNVWGPLVVLGSAYCSSDVRGTRLMVPLLRWDRLRLKLGQGPGHEAPELRKLLCTRWKLR